MPCLISLELDLMLRVCSTTSCRAPHKYVLVVSNEVDKLTFLFGAQTGPDLYGFGRVFGINLYGLGVLVRLENAGLCGHGQVGWRCRYPEAELP
jgi:hypothetical protein